MGSAGAVQFRYSSASVVEITWIQWVPRAGWKLQESPIIATRIGRRGRGCVHATMMSTRMLTKPAPIEKFSLADY